MEISIYFYNWFLGPPCSSLQFWNWWLPHFGIAQLLTDTTPTPFLFSSTQHGSYGERYIYLYLIYHTKSTNWLTVVQYAIHRSDRKQWGKERIFFLKLGFACLMLGKRSIRTYSSKWWFLAWWFTMGSNPSKISKQIQERWVFHHGKSPFSHFDRLAVEIFQDAAQWQGDHVQSIVGSMSWWYKFQWLKMSSTKLLFQHESHLAGW